MLMGAAGNGAAPEVVREQSVIRGVDQEEVRRETNLTGYSVTGHYSVRSNRFQTSAEMTVSIVYRKGAGKSYQVLSRSGSSVLQTRVLDRLLQEEEAMSRGEIRQNVVVTSANYKMRLISKESIVGRPCEVLDLTPLKKSPHLLKSRAWVDAEDHSLVRIEGRPVVSASFWAGRPLIVRDYERIEGFSMATRSHALAETLLMGKTELTIEYSDYKITGSAD
jgi:hypothetical protein